MKSSAATVKDYLASLPADRRAAIEAVRAVILKNLDSDYAEVMSYGMIGYVVPHGVFPAGYHCDPKQPLPFAGVGSQKNHMAIYLMCTYGNKEHDAWFRTAWAKTGKKLDMGKSCVRFKKLDDVALDVVGESIRRVPAAKYIEHYKGLLAAMGKGLDGKPLKTAKAATVKGVVAPRKRIASSKPAKKGARSR